MSLGAGTYATACDSDYLGGLFRNAFEKLRAQGVVPVVAAGNSGTIGAIAFPACVSNALPVAAARLKDARLGIHIHSTRLGAPVFSRDAGKVLRLASNSKLFPTAAALSLLAGSAAAFAPAQMARSSTALNAEKSKALPFMNRPALVSNDSCRLTFLCHFVAKCIPYLKKCSRFPYVT